MLTSSSFVVLIDNGVFESGFTVIIMQGHRVTTNIEKASLRGVGPSGARSPKGGGPEAPKAHRSKDEDQV